MNPEKVYSEFSNRTELFVKSILEAYVPESHGSGKAIHDCVWGTVQFYPWELKIIDSPIIERLRRINQLGLALYTYPSAQHSRFEHTLGVVAVLSEMISSINHDGAVCLGGKSFVIPEQNIRKLRLAALLHDVGHCFFSHVSETQYGLYEEFQILKEHYPVFKKAAPHEMMGYMIVNTPSFIEFIRKDSGYPFYPGENAEKLMSDIGRMIVGDYLDSYLDPVSGKTICDYYMTQFINGEFDADSLDYLRRDSYTTGIALSYHIDRFLYKMRLVEFFLDSIQGRYLTVASSGVSTVEEMVFSKLQLTRHIYRHQKVLATESMVGDIVLGLRNEGYFTHPCDFLYWCDGDILGLRPSFVPELTNRLSLVPLSENSSFTVGDAVSHIVSRQLPKIALIINHSSISSVNGISADQSDVSTLFGLLTFGDLRQEILEETNRILRKFGRKEKEIYSIHTAIPKLKMSKNFTDSLVELNDGRLVPLSEIMDMSDWVSDFTRQSWKAFVFADSDNEFVCLASLNVLEKRGIRFDYGKLLPGLKFRSKFEKIVADLKKLMD